jgi:hypothetical protein
MVQDDLTNWKSATPFAYGAGQLQPNLVVDPRLICDITGEDYLNYSWDRGVGVAHLDDFYKPVTTNLHKQKHHSTYWTLIIQQ